MEAYVRFVCKNTEFFSTYDAEVLLSNLIQFADAQGFKCDVSKDKYKVKISVLLDEGETVDLVSRILKVDDEKVCMEFSKTGCCDSLLFFDQFNKIKEYMGDYINATY